MHMAAPGEPLRVIHLRAPDSSTPSVIVHVFQAGSCPLDLELVASEGKDAFSVSLTAERIGYYKHPNFQSSDATWEAALAATLLLDKPPEGAKDELQGLECLAQFTQDPPTLSLVWKRSIEGVTVAAAKLYLNAQARIHELQNESQQQKDNVSKLQQQLQDLIQAKKDHEDELFRKFADLLNAKKAKIRDQQRLLAVAHVDPEKGEQLQGRRQVPESSRQGKRKGAAGQLDLEDSEDASSDAFEDVPDEKAEDEGDEDEGSTTLTPEPVEDETASDREMSEPSLPSEPKRGIKRGLGGRTRKADVTAETDQKATKPSEKPSLHASQNLSEKDMAPNISQRTTRSQTLQSSTQEGNVRQPPQRDLTSTTRITRAQDQELGQDLAPSQENFASPSIGGPQGQIAADGGGADDDTTDDEL